MTLEILTLANITSLEGEHTLDFTAEPLRSAGIFAITGDTGSGKSTLLDAICLALYGTAPRFESAYRGQTDVLRQSGTDLPEDHPADPRSVLRRGAKEGYVRLRFRSASGKRYEAFWRVYITRGGNLNVKRALYECLSKGKDICLSEQVREINELIKRIVGLDKEQFTRTVLLAQNSFAAFLQADDRQKSILLEKLTGTEIYGNISMAIHTLEGEAVKEVNDLTRECSGATKNLLSDEVLKITTEERDALVRLRNDKQAQHKRAEQLLNWYALNDKARANLNLREEEFARVNKEFLALGSERTRLERYDAVLNLHTLYEQIRETQTNLHELTRNEASTRAQISTVQQELNTAQQELNTAYDRRQTLEERQRLRQADLNRGRTLEGERRNLVEVLNTAQQHLERAERHKANALSEQDKQHKEVENLKAQSKLLEETFQNLLPHRRMFDKFQTVTEKLKRFNTTTAEKLRIASDLEKANARIQENTALRDRTQTKQQDLDDRLSAERSALDIQKRALAELDGTQISKIIAQTKHRQTLLQNARSLWTEIVQGYESLSEHRNVIQRRTGEITAINGELHSAGQELSRTTNNFTRLSQAYTVSLTENIIALRRQLRPGTPCPLCGSSHHPYNTEKEQETGEARAHLQADYEAAKRNNEAAQQQYETLLLRSERLKGEQQTDEVAFQKAKQQQEARTANWGAYAQLDPSFKECSSSVNREARFSTIDILIEACVQTLTEQEERFKRYEKHEAERRCHDAEVERLNVETQQAQQRLNDIRTQLEVDIAQRDTLQRQLETSNTEHTHLTHELDELLTLPGWNKSEGEAYQQRISTLFEQWERVNQERTVCRQQLDIVGERLAHADRQVAEMEKRTNEARAERDHQKEMLGQKEDELRRLFGTYTVDQVAEELEREVSQGKAAFEAAERTMTERRTEADTLRGTMKRIATQLITTREHLSSRRQDMDRRIALFNLDHDPLTLSELDNLFSDTQDWNTLRQQLRDRENDLIIARQEKDRATNEYTRLQSDPMRPAEDREDEGREQLAETLTRLESEQEAVEQQLSACQQKLYLHQDGIDKAQHFEADIRKARENAEEWTRLKDIFGSADGKKFRDMAQSFTFTILVEHANFHLRQLSPRYELRVLPGSLILEIVDHAMLDEHRFVTSLSGGETFIVALALALGLASLSGTTLNIGCLFIDEGFGHLDHDSLALVLDTLSALESRQGRKVGVVSHTEQIRDQIFPQIRLTRLGNNGSSTLEVL